MTKKPTLAVIAGGGCRQIEAATGVLQAMEAAGIKIDLYRGCSAGACVAALHASGVDGNALETIIRKTPAKKIFRVCGVTRSPRSSAPTSGMCLTVPASSTC